MGGDGGAAGQARRAEADENARTSRIQEGSQKIRDMFAESFRPGYYADLNKSVTDYYTPQVQDQYKESLRQLQGALLRNGIYDSTAGNKQIAKAGESLDLAKQQVQQRATGMIAQRKQDVANAENVAQSQLQSSADPVAAAAQASNLIATNTAKPEFSPLGQVFQDFTAGLAQQSDLERSGNARYNVGVSNWGNSLKRYAQNIGS